MKQFSIKQYLIDNQLANEEGELLESDKLPKNPAWSLGPYASDEAMIYLCVLVKFFEEKAMLDNLSITLKKSDELYFTIKIDEINRRYDYAHSNYRWDIIIDVIDYLLPCMASSNVSYLADGLFFDS